MLSTLIKIRLKGMLATMASKGKKKNKIGKGTIILYTLLAIYLLGVFYFMFASMFGTLISSLHAFSLEWVYFAVVGAIAFTLAFIGSVFLAQQELYNAKDNDLLFSMPIKKMDILLSRVFSILILNYVYVGLVYIPAAIVFIQNKGFEFMQFVFFTMSFLSLPFLILAVSCFFGWIIANVMKRITHKNIVVLAMYSIFLGGYFYIIFAGQQYIMEFFQQGEKIADIVKNVLPPLYFMAVGIYDVNYMYFAIYLLCMIIPFILVIYVLSKNFISLSTSKPKTKHIAYVEKEMKQNSMTKALLLRELRHFTNNPIIILNAAMGTIMTLMACVGVVYVYIAQADMVDELLTLVNTIEMKEYVPAIAILMVATTSSVNVISASSISLEGNSLWILKSLPIRVMDILNTKLLFHIIACIPAGLILSIFVSILLKLSILDTIVVILVPILLTLFVSAFGLIMNLWKPKFDWVNENAVVKQGMPVLITMFSSMGLVFLSPVAFYQFFDGFMNVTQFLYLVILVLVVVDASLYYLINTWGVRKFDTLSA